MEPRALQVGIIHADGLVSVGPLHPGQGVVLTAHRESDERPPRYDLLRFHDDGATLFLRRGMTGRVRVGDVVQDVGELVARTLPEDADVVPLKLGERDQGRVVVGSVSVMWRAAKDSDAQGVELTLPKGFTFG